MELVPNVPTLQAIERPKKGKGTKVIVLTYQEKSIVQLVMFYKYERKVTYIHNDDVKGKKRKKVMKEETTKLEESQIKEAHA